MKKLSKDSVFLISETKSWYDCFYAEREANADRWIEKIKAADYISLVISRYSERGGYCVQEEEWYAQIWLNWRRT